MCAAGGLHASLLLRHQHSSMRSVSVLAMLSTFLYVRGTHRQHTQLQVCMG